VVVEDRPGAGTILATAAIAKAAADGYTIGIATNSFLINPAIHLKLPYDTHSDFVSITMIATQPVALVANAAFPANTLAEVIEVARRSAEPLNYTSPGPRGVGHLAGEMLKQRAGINMQHISYNGSAPALNDVIGGRVPLMFDGIRRGATSRPASSSSSPAPASRRCPAPSMRQPSRRRFPPSMWSPSTP
jgi:tripartite-type tricarboxylate transporter receptor subunit TctC